MRKQIYYLLDTNSIIYYLQGYKVLDTIFERFVKGTAIPVISIITEIELLGFKEITTKEKRLITKLLSNFQVYEVNKEIADETIRIRKRYSLRIPDAIIAATAVIKEAILVTRDEAHFKKIKGLVTLNPFRKRIP
ncbi:hypothetical protein ES707_11785 [subsurface metagenome]